MMSEVLANKIYTRRLLLRQIMVGDAPTLVRWSQSSDAFGDYLSAHPLAQDEALRRINDGLYWNQLSKTFLIELRDGPPLGTICYWLKKEDRQICDIAIKVAEKSYRNLGYGTEAQKYLIIFLFEQLKVRQVEMTTDIDNKAQERCLHKLGFEKNKLLQYQDQQVQRTGHLFILGHDAFQQAPIYKYHYE